ncbi:hypothetical protein AX16_009300 [Volvariella volvacea WC 439]|nr:hypothetical protein AX16_009300 [Volvariella volvacea WC 439]
MTSVSTSSTLSVDILSRSISASTSASQSQPHSRSNSALVSPAQEMPYSNDISTSSLLSASSNASSASSRSSHSFSSADTGRRDEEDLTITASMSSMSLKRVGKQKSHDDLRLLAVSTHMTELSYTISDIQTRIFEIQELRHKSQSTSSGSTGETANTTAVIDKSLASLDERLQSVEQGIKSITDALEPLKGGSANGHTPTPTSYGPGQRTEEEEALLRKHSALLQEWEAVQSETKVLREELREDKWLTVFRTVTDQADGMMSSLEKAVNRCQDFIWAVHHRGMDDYALSGLASSTSSMPSRDGKLQVSLENFNTLLESYEAKKKHYMPATSKVLSIIDKGVHDRVTKNGETLRRHAESAQRWKNLRERISRTDMEMENIRMILLNGDMSPSENGSSTSHVGGGGGSVGASVRNGYLTTPSNGGGRGRRTPSSASTISRSISPLRKFAKKITGSGSKSASVTPLNVNKSGASMFSREPSSEPTKKSKVTSSSVFNPMKSQSSITPEKSTAGPGHKYSNSLTPDSSPLHGGIGLGTASSSSGGGLNRSVTDGHSTIRSSRASQAPNRQPWNSSTKIEPEDKPRMARSASRPRAPSVAGHYSNYTSTASTTTSITTGITPQRRAPSVTGYYGGHNGVIPPVPPISGATPHKRSLSRASMSSSRPWSPEGSTTFHQQVQAFRPPSRSHTPSAYAKLGMGHPTSSPGNGNGPGAGVGVGYGPPPTPTPKPRPKTPSHIPRPSLSGMSSITNGNGAGKVGYKTISSASGSELGSPRGGGFGGEDDEDARLTSLQRAFSPTFSTSEMSNTSGGGSAGGGGGERGCHPPRPPSRSMIPVPSVHLSPSSRPPSSMSNYASISMALDSPPSMKRNFSSAGTSSVGGYDDSTSVSGKSAGGGGQAMYFGSRGRASLSGSGFTSPAPSKVSGPPPSSFKDSTGAGNVGGGRTSRPGSRSGVYGSSTAASSSIDLGSYNPFSYSGAGAGGAGGVAQEYVVGNPKDPLDVEIGNIFNGLIRNGLLGPGLIIERADPHLRKAPKEGAEVKAQYMIGNGLSRKVVTCRLTTLTSGRTSIGGEEGGRPASVMGHSGGGTKKKVMCRVGGGWQDLGQYLVSRQAAL